MSKSLYDHPLEDAMGGRPKAQIALSETEPKRLEAWACHRNRARALSMRSQVVLSCADGLNNKEVAVRLRVIPQTASKCRNRSAEQRLRGVLVAPRLGAPRTVDDAKVDGLIARTLESVPTNAMGSLAREMGMPEKEVTGVWRVFGLQPHRQENFKLFPDPPFVEKVRAIVGLNLDPLTKAPILCVDERCQIHWLSRTQSIVPVALGIQKRRTYDHMPHGTTMLCAVLDICTGEAIGELYRRCSNTEFLRSRRTSDANVPAKLDSHPVTDSDRTHNTLSVGSRFAHHSCFHIHFSDFRLLGQTGRALVVDAARETSPPMTSSAALKPSVCEHLAQEAR